MKGDASDASGGEDEWCAAAKMPVVENDGAEKSDADDDVNNDTKPSSNNSMSKRRRQQRRTRSDGDSEMIDDGDDDDGAKQPTHKKMKHETTTSSSTSPSKAQVHYSIPFASSIDEYLQSPHEYAPRPEWCNPTTISSSVASNQNADPADSVAAARMNAQNNEAAAVALLGGVNNANANNNNDDAANAAAMMMMNAIDIDPMLLPPPPPAAGPNEFGLIELLARIRNNLQAGQNAAGGAGVAAAGAQEGIINNNNNDNIENAAAGGIHRDEVMANQLFNARQAVRPNNNNNNHERHHHHRRRRALQNVAPDGAAQQQQQRGLAMGAQQLRRVIGNIPGLSPQQREFLRNVLGGARQVVDLAAIDQVLRAAARQAAQQQQQQQPILNLQALNAFPWLILRGGRGEQPLLQVQNQQPQQQLQPPAQQPPGQQAPPQPQPQQPAQPELDPEVDANAPEINNALNNTNNNADDGRQRQAAAPGKIAVFGNELDTALHIAIKRGAVDAALNLIEGGACIDFPNAKGITPLMVASQEGNVVIARALLDKGAQANNTTTRGSTALIQACHFGRLDVVEELLRHGALIEQANYKNTTALMRASQEGHEAVVRLLLQHQCVVNRRNDERMTALMLCSQRGHSGIVKMLIKAGAEIDAKTAQDSTSLMLACKRRNLEVAKILVAAGTELKLKDGKNRTVLETATRRGNTDFARILTDNAQIRLVKEQARRERSFCMIRLWHLLQWERATIRGFPSNLTIHGLARDIDNPLTNLCQSKRSLIRAMTLPAPVIELITSFIPLPLSWEKRLDLLTSRSHTDPDTAVYNALDLIDEVIEEGGVLEALDFAGMSPPSSFSSWKDFRGWCGRCNVIMSRCQDEDTSNIFARDGTDDNTRRQVESAQLQRRSANYLQVLSRAPINLTEVLASPPYEMPSLLLEKLKSNGDIQSLVRRLPTGEVHFETSIANEMVVLARMAVMWCESRPFY